LPTAADYEDEEEYDLEDPKSKQIKTIQVSGRKLSAQKKKNSYCVSRINGILDKLKVMGLLSHENQ
jgi:hypothetical protein